MTQRMEDIREEIKSIEGHARFLLERCRAVQNCERQLQNANEQLKRGLDNWFDAERIHVKSLGGRVFDEHDPVVKGNETMTSTITSFTQEVTSKRVTENDLPNYIGLTLIAFFESELTMVESFKELFKVHDEMARDIESSNNKITKMENQKNAKLEQLTDLRRILDDKQACLNAFYKGFIYFTIPYMARQRASYARRFFSGFICSELSNNYTIFKACQDYFHQLVLPIQEVSEETSRMLELLNVKPIAKLPYEEIEPIGLGTKSSDSQVSPVSGEKRLSVVPKSTNLFMSYESDGLNGLFERAIVLSKKKPLEKTAAAPAPVTTTHLFTSSIAPLNAPGNNNPPMNTTTTTSVLTGSNSNSNLAAATSEVNLNNDSGDHQHHHHAEAVHPPPSPAIAAAVPASNPLARRGSAVKHNTEKESLPRFMEPGDEVHDSHTSSSNFQEVSDENPPDIVVPTTAPIAPRGPPEQSEKSKNILDSLLGGGGETSPSKSPQGGGGRASAPAKRQNIWDDA
jgi:hypothetical protein